MAPSRIAQASAQLQVPSMVPIYLAGILVYLLLIPEQFSVEFFGFNLPPYRLFMLPATLYLLFSAVSGRLRFAWPDLMVGLCAAWIWLAAYMTSGQISTAVSMGGSHTLDIAFAYFFARASIRSPRDMRLFLVLVAPGLAICSLFVVLEAVLHYRFIQNTASSITGVSHMFRDDTRLGFMRGTGPFPHPILAGLFMASFLPIYLASGLRGWPKWAGVTASVGAFFTMSSAALLALLMGGLLWCYDWVSQRFANASWKLFLAAAAVLFVTVELVSDSGFYSLMVRYASLNTATAYNRVLIWEFGTENIINNPWFGIGYDDWDRPVWMHSGSFDHFWLIMALRFGIPASLLIVAAAVGGIALAALRSSNHRPENARLLRGIAIALAVFALGGLSVSLWLSVLVWFFMLLGIAVSLGISMDQISVRRPMVPVRKVAPAPAQLPRRPLARNGPKAGL